MSRNYVNDGDVGCGAPGSLDWHKAWLGQQTTAEQVQYLNDVWADLSDEDKLALTIHLIEKADESDSNGDS